MKTKIGKMETQLLALLRDGGFHSARELASTIGVSTKTVRSRLAVMTEQLADQGVEIVSSSGSGYRMSCDDPDLLEKRLDGEDSFPGFLGTVVNADRAVIMLYYILSREDSVTIEDLASYFYVSVSTVKKNIIYVRKILEGFSLKLVSRRGGGMEIVGREHDIRMCINYVLDMQRKYREQDDTEGMGPSFDPKTTREMEKVIFNVVSHETGFRFSFTSVHFLAKLIRVSAKRNAAGFYLQDYDTSTVNQFTSRVSFVMARRILKDAEELLKCRFTENDVLMISICLVALRVIIRVDQTYETNYMVQKNLACELVDYLAAINGIDGLSLDNRMVDAVARRIESLRARSMAHLRQSSITGFMDPAPLFARQLACQSVYFLKQHYGLDINSDNIDILTILFHQYHSSRTLEAAKLRGCVATLFDYQFSLNYAGQLRRCLNGLLNQIDVRDMTGLSGKDLRSYDVIFAFRQLLGRFDFIPSVPLFAIKSQYPAEAAAQFREWYLENILKIRALPLFENMPVKPIKASDWKQCLHEIALDLDPQKAEEVEDSLAVMQQISPDEPLDNVVIITGLHPNCDNITLRAYVMKKPVIWGEKENRAQLVICWDGGRKKTDMVHFRNDYLTRMIQLVFQKRQLVSRIIIEHSCDGVSEVFREVHQEVLEQLFGHIEE